MRPINPPESFLDLTFPLAGIDLSLGFTAQKAGTTRVGQNCRAFEIATGRARGGSRPGISKLGNSTVAGAFWVQEIQLTVVTGDNYPGA